MSVVKLGSLEQYWGEKSDICIKWSMLLELLLSPYNPLMAGLKTRPYSLCVPWGSLDVKVLGVIARIFHIVQCKAFSYTQWQWLFDLSPSVRRPAAASERSQPPILPNHCPVLNEQVLLNAAGHTLIFKSFSGLPLSLKSKPNEERDLFSHVLSSLWRNVTGAAQHLHCKWRRWAEQKHLAKEVPDCTWTTDVPGPIPKLEPIFNSFMVLYLLPSWLSAVTEAQGLEGTLRNSQVLLFPGTVGAIRYSRGENSCVHAAASADSASTGAA